MTSSSEKGTQTVLVLSRNLGIKSWEDPCLVQCGENVREESDSEYAYV